jgi:hypothetical protein
MISVKEKLLPALGLVVLVLAAAISISTCKTKQAASGGGAMGPEKLTVEAVAAVMGNAGLRQTGVFDVSESENEYFIVYHFYTREVEDLDDDIGIEMAPKIRDLYAKFKHLDRVIFDVDVWREGVDPEWISYCHFLMTRQVYEKTAWTGVLDKEFFKIVLDLNYNEMMGTPKR